MSYGDVDDVIAATGVEFQDLGFDDKPALEDWIERRLDAITDVMNRKMRHDWEADSGEVPPGLDEIATGAVAGAVRNALVSRQSPTVRIDDFAIRTIQTPMLSTDQEAALKDYTVTVGMVDLAQADIAESWAVAVDLDEG